MEIYKQYCELQKKIDLLEEEKDVLRAKISDSLPEDGYKDEDITAFWKTTKKWQYSPKVKGLETELKATKKAEEESGEAKFEEVKSLTISVK